jgi:hypothetical protein
LSWFYGVCDRRLDNSNEIENHPSHNNRLLCIKTQNFYINAGGNASTIFHHKIDETRGWLILGVGIISNSIEYQLLEHSGWAELLLNNKLDIESLGGHYIIIRWQKDKITFHTDRLGLRDFYFRQRKNSIVFSTRLDWLKDEDSMQIDFQEFGSRWLLFNQLSTNSVLKNVTRIVCGQSLSINTQTLETKIEKPFWLPMLNQGIEQYTQHDFSDMLEKLIVMNPEKKVHTSLSLSGGLDSRVLLSYLLKNKGRVNWDAHTFGSSQSSDYKIANKISVRLGFQHYLLNEDMPDYETIRQEMDEYVLQSVVNNSASMIVPLRNYELLKLWHNTIIIDGGFGEIWRREFLAKLFFQGKQAIFQKDISKIISCMRLHRAEIFTEEVTNSMYEGCKIQTENLINKLPNIALIGIENWIDLFAIKTRLPNYYGHEQTRLDSMIVSYMPLIQIDLLKNILRMPVELRINARLYRQIIAENNIGLTKIGLAKSNFVHPFALTTLQTRLWNKITKRLHIKKCKDDSAMKFLNMMKEYIDDLCSSSDFQQCGIYDSKKITKILSRFNNNQELLNEVNWLLAFETFRRKIS